jgi:hypothetical protein
MTRYSHNQEARMRRNPVIWTCRVCNHREWGVHEDPPDHCPGCNDHDDRLLWPDREAAIKAIGCENFHRDYERTGLYWPMNLAQSRV